MASKPISITLPEAMLDQVDHASKTEHRTRSELIREALRHYLALRRIPTVEATPEETAAIEAGEAEHERGDFVSLEDLKHDLALTPRQKRPKKAQNVSS